MTRGRGETAKRDFQQAAGNWQLAGKRHPVYGIIAACCELTAACFLSLYALCPMPLHRNFFLTVTTRLDT
jgi:hypothetical protein